MARLVKLEGKEPLEVEAGDESKWICTCGLSANFPFCDGSHKRAEDEEEGSVYVYDEESRVRLK